MQRYTFFANDAQRPEALKALRANSPLHKVMLILITVAALWFVVCFLMMNQMIHIDSPAAGSNEPEMATVIIRLILVYMTTLLFAGTPLIALIQFRRAWVDGAVMNRRMESFTLSEAAIEHSYCFRINRRREYGIGFQSSYTVIKYSDIDHIEYYEQENALKVFGKVYFCKEEGIPVDQNDIIRILDEPGKAYRVFFLYYDSAEQLMQLLTERSGIQIKRQSSCSSSLQEVKNKGVG